MMVRCPVASLLFLLTLCGFVHPAQAQSPNAPDAVQAPAAENGAPAGVEAVYERMSLAYELRDADAVADLYAEDAHYILPDEERRVVTGRDAIRDIFADFFQAVALQQSELTIDFRFVRRSQEGDVAYDVGYYRVRVLREGEEMSASTGKFSTVLRRMDDGRWRFVVDAYSPAPHKAYDALAPADSASR